MTSHPGEPVVRAPRARLGSEPGLIDSLLFIFVVFYGSHALFLLLVIGPENLTDNQLTELPGGFFRALWAAAYGGVALLCVRHFDGLYGTLRQSGVLLALVGWAVVSTLWSSEPPVTLQHSVTLGICAIMGLYFGTRYSTDGILAICAYAFGLALVLSAILIVLVPGWGVMPGLHEGSWSGIFIHKNGLGSAAVLGLISFGYMAQRSARTERLAWLGFGVLAVVLVVGSRSATALVTLLAVMVAARLVGVVRLRGVDLSLVMIAALTLGIMLAWLIGSNLEALLTALGKDLTLTGRLSLWGWGLEGFLERPLGGYGFESFWSDPGDYGGLRVRALAGWVAPHIHNSWLQIALDLGLVGLSLFVVFFARLVWHAVALTRATAAPAYKAVLLIVVMILLYSVVETLLLKRNSATFILLVAFYASLGREFMLSRAGLVAGWWPEPETPASSE